MFNLHLQFTSVFKMADKKNDKKVNEVLKEQELDKVTGGRAEMPARPESESENNVPNIHWQSYLGI